MAYKGKGKQEGYLKQAVIISAIIVAGFALQIVIGNFDFKIIAYPVNLIIGALLLLPLFIKLPPAVQRFGSGRVSVIILAIVLVMTLYMGLVPGNSVKYSWPFAFLYLLTLINLSLALGRRVRSFSFKRDYSFLLNHLGLLIFLFAAGPGSADMERWFMSVPEGEVEWRGISSLNTNPVELPIAILLNDFVMDEYPPKIVMVDKRSGETQPKNRFHFLEVKESNRGEILDWSVVVDSFNYRPMMAPIAHITAKNLRDGRELTGAVSCGNFFQPHAILDIDQDYCFAMTFPEPERFSSDIVVFTKDGGEVNGTVMVNSPLSVGSWRIYQYSYDTQRGRDSEISVFELVYDRWLVLIYIGIAMIMLGSVTLLFKGGGK